MHKILSQFLNQFKKNHNNQIPQEIVVAPVALASLAIKKSANTKIEGVPVVCRLFSQKEVIPRGKGTRLGIFVHNNAGDLSLRSCDLV